MAANMDCLVLLMSVEQQYRDEQAKKLYRALIYTHLPMLQKWSEIISNSQDSFFLESLKISVRTLF